MRHAALYHHPAETKLGFTGVFRIFFQGNCRGDIKDKLILELIKNDHYETGNATKGQRISPEPASLHLTCSSSDVRPIRTVRVGTVPSGEETQLRWTKSGLEERNKGLRCWDGGSSGGGGKWVVVV